MAQTAQDGKKSGLAKKIFAGLGIFLAVVVVALGVLLVQLPALLGSLVTNESGSRLGREVTLAQDPAIRWHWTHPRITLTGLRIANAPGSAEPLMFEAEEISAEIMIWKLLYGRAEFPFLSLTKPRLVLEKDEDGKANWDMPALSSGNMTAEAVMPDDRYDFPAIGRLTVEDGAVIYKDARKKLNVDLKLTAVRGSSDEDETIEVTGKGTLRDKPFAIEARGGTLDLLRDSRQEFPLDLSLNMGGTTVDVKGTFVDPVRMEGMDATLALAGPNMADIFYLTGIPLPPTPKYSITGQLVKEGDLWSYNGFQGKVGGSDLSGDVSYDISGERGYFKGVLTSRRMGIDDLGGFIGMAPGDEKTAKAADRVLPDVPLDLARLRATDMDVTLKAAKLDAPNLPFNSMNVRFLLENGVLTLDPMELALAQGMARGKLTLDGSRDIPKVKADVNLSDVQLARFFDGTRFEKETRGIIGGRIALSGDGKSLARVLGDSDGEAAVVMNGGRLSLLLVEAADIDLAEAVPLLLGDDRTTEINCVVGDFGINKGQLKSRTFVMDTSDSAIKGDVDINLQRETIDAEFDAKPKDPSPLSLQSPILVKGTLKNPSVTLEPVETGLRAAGAAALGVVLTPFAAILPFIETGAGKDSNCHALITNAKNNHGDAIVDGASQKKE